MKAEALLDLLKEIVLGIADDDGNQGHAEIYQFITDYGLTFEQAITLYQIANGEELS